MTLSAAISSICGVTEPAIYGFAVPEKIPFACLLAGSGVGGATLGFFGIKKYSMGALGIFGIPNYINPEGGAGGELIGVLIGISVSTLVAFVLTMMLWKDNSESEEA